MTRKRPRVDIDSGMNWCDPVKMYITASVLDYHYFAVSFTDSADDEDPETQVFDRTAKGRADARRWLNFNSGADVIFVD